MMNVIETALPGVLIVEPRIAGDERGFFMESFQQRRYAEAGIQGSFVQDNVSFSRYGVLRGLHFQHPHAQGKLVQALAGEVFDVAVDIRRGSPSFGRWFGVALTAENARQLWVPPGFAHGFCVTSETALVAYKCTDYYDASAEHSLVWDDPAIGIEWPVRRPLLSEKDAEAARLSDTKRLRLPDYEAAGAHS
jgi:dTDP-4-dehydrorhamnose 3,5-epimerase